MKTLLQANTDKPRKFELLFFEILAILKYISDTMDSENRVFLCTICEYYLYKTYGFFVCKETSPWYIFISTSQ